MKEMRVQDDLVISILDGWRDGVETNTGGIEKGEQILGKKRNPF